MSPESENERRKCMKINWGNCFRVLTFRKPKEKDQHDKSGLDRNRYQQLAPQVRCILLRTSINSVQRP